VQVLYDLARLEKVEVPTRTVEVYKRNFGLAGRFSELDVAITCGSGTYIRAIARDCSRKLVVPLAALTRTQSSGFHLSDSLSFDELEAQLQQGTFTRFYRQWRCI